MRCHAATQEAAEGVRWMQGMLAQILTCIGASAAVFLTYTLLVVVQTEPWYSPQYFIPILGEIHPLLPTPASRFLQPFLPLN